MVVNKMDEPGAAEQLKAFKKATRTKPLAISCLLEQGLEELRVTLFSFARELMEP